MCWQLAWERVNVLTGALWCFAATMLPIGEAVGASHYPPTLTVGYAFDENSFQRRALDAFVKGVAASKVARLQPIPARRFGDNETALLEAARKGRVDLAVVPFEAVAKENEAFRVFTTPFVFDSFPHLRSVQSGTVGRDLLLELRKTGVQGVGWWAGEFVTLAGDRPALDPSDLRERRIGYKERSIEGMAWPTAVPELSKAVGAYATSLPPALFETRVPFSAFDLVEATPKQLQQSRETPRFITLTNHLNTGYVVVANLESWGKLSSVSKAELEKAFERANNIATEGLRRQQASLMEGAPGNAGVIALTSADRAKWREQTRLADSDGALGTLIKRAQEQLVAVLRSGTAPEARISWNTWLEDGQGKDVASLTVGKVSRLNLDLGRLPYQRLLKTTPDPKLKAALSSGEPLKLLIQPILLGSHLEPAPGQPLGPALIAVSLKNAKTQTTDEQKLEKYWSGKLSTRQLAATLGLGDIAQWSVKADHAGCADVAFAVWDEARAEPLDHIIVSLPVQKEGGEKVVCYGRVDSTDMAAGLETMLRLPRTGRIVADVSLHVFEHGYPGDARSVAVLVHAKRLAAARNNPAATDPGVYAWELVSALSRYASEPGQLPKLVGEAHQRVDTGKPFPYEDVAGSLASVLFGGRTERDADQAKMAEAAFKDAVANGDPARVLMRLVNEQGRAMFLPLGVLAASATAPFVSKRFSVIQSLPSSATGAPSCIRSWHVARSLTLHGAVGSEHEMLVQAPQQLTSPAELMTTHDAVAKYLSSQSTGTEGEGCCRRPKTDQQNRVVPTGN